jgi:HemY protein
MIRVLLYLVVVGLVAFGAVWLAERPGDVAITWQGERLETSVMVLAAAVAAVAVVAVVLWSILRALVRAPDAIARRLHARRSERGHRAVSHGLIAVGSGDARAARRFTQDAKRLAPGAPLTLLLSAQAAQLAGDGAGAAATFKEMADRDDTRVLGLHGLFVEAQRRNDASAALFYAEEAAKHASSPAWAGQAVLEMRCGAGDWSGALERLERNQRSGLIDKVAYRRQRAVLLTAQALAAEEDASLSTSGKPDVDRERARTLALEAVKLAPTLVPAAALAGRLLAAAGEKRKAARVIEAAWRANPHPDLADAYLRPGDSARERLERIQALAALAAGDAEAAIAVARAALDAKEFTIGKQMLAPFVGAPTKRVAALMAALELQSGDEGRGREWMARALNARRDPAWTADGFVSDHWLPISPVTGRLDAFEWKDPLAGEEHAGAVIDAERHALLEPPPSVAAAASAAAAAALAGAAATGAASAVDPPPAPPAPPLPVRGERSRAERAGEGDSPHGELPEVAPHPDPLPSGERERTERGDGQYAEPQEKESSDLAASSQDAFAEPEAARAPPVIPLVHAPDDPGPNAEAPAEPAAEGAESPPADGWGRFRSLFKP